MMKRGDLTLLGPTDKAKCPNKFLTVELKVHPCLFILF
jgi:hypothetical protein